MTQIQLNRLRDFYDDFEDLQLSWISPGSFPESVYIFELNPVWKWEFPLREHKTVVLACQTLKDRVKEELDRCISISVITPEKKLIKGVSSVRISFTFRNILD